MLIVLVGVKSYMNKFGANKLKIYLLMKIVNTTRVMKKVITQVMKVTIQAHLRI